MQPNLFIKYKGAEHESEIDLALLGESIIGFHKVINELFKIANIKGQISIKATSPRSGSIIFDIFVNILTTIPFDNFQDYYDFLAVIGHLPTTGEIYLLNNAHQDVNAYFRRNSFDQGWFFIFLAMLIKWSPKQKKTITTQDEDGNKLPPKHAAKLQSLIKRKRFNKDLKPFVEDEVSEIVVSPDRDFKIKATINNNNFADYLSEDQQICPEFINGKAYKMTGRILNLQSAKGDYMKFKADNMNPKYNLLVALPKEGSKTEHYKDFYKQRVNILSEIIRESVYKKPKIKILTIELLQKPMV